MVMKQDVLGKNLTQSIRRSMGRYLAIVLIIALGSAMFVGLRMTKLDMVETGHVFTDEQNAFDLRLMSSYGWTAEQVEAVQALPGLEAVEASVYQDAIVHLGDSQEDLVYRFLSLTESINLVDLRGGRMPQAPNECLADGFYFNDSHLGMTVTLSDANTQDILDALAQDTYTIVGYVASPLYMDTNRGSTNVGNGNIKSYFYIPADGFSVDYYTEINVTLPGNYRIYSQEYNQVLDDMAEILKPQIQGIADNWFQDLLANAEAEYAEGYQQYLDGLAELEQGRLDAETELGDAYQKLKDAQDEIDKNERLLNKGANQIKDAKQTLSDNKAKLEDGKKQLAQAKKDTYAQLDASQKELDTHAAQVAEGKAQAEAGLAQIDDGLAQINDGISQLEPVLKILNPLVSTARKTLDMIQSFVGNNEELSLLKEKSDVFFQEFRQNVQVELQDLLDSGVLEGDLRAATQTLVDNLPNLEQYLITQVHGLLNGYSKQLDELYVMRNTLNTQRQDVLTALEELKAAQAAIDEGYAQLLDGRNQADREFADAEKEITDSERQLKDAQKTLANEEAKLKDGRNQLNKGKNELIDGWKEYEEGELEAHQKLSDAEAELEDAAIKLADARAEIDDLESPEIYVLDRNTNIGYASLDSNSDIVAGVSRVFPVFFLLIAALVCITTMTRMVNEERTQIGTLKALGYSNRAIISKYLIYAGSGAILGCGLGVLLGSILFPKLIWDAYGTMLYIEPKVQICFNWGLCAAVVAAYTVVVLSVTWYCCDNALKEVPSELIRPKAPTSGKKIFLEYLPFWKRISFLNKVALRNIFRYRQRLLMMLVGIGGCTALLLTGFGLRDSIGNIISYQYETITAYDLEIYFDEGCTWEEQAAFQTAVGDQASQILFYHQASAEIDFQDQVREVTLIAAGDEIADFIDFRRKDIPQPLPGVDETLLSIGVAEAMGVTVGDTILVRNADMEELELVVCGIYENYVANFAIILPETIAAQWGREAEQQMAMIQVADDYDLHETSAAIMELDGVMNVTISQDTADMVGSMLDALDLLVVLVVFCAGLLAVTVLYNLINININERIREIATIKVLGFRAKETASYVFKENMVLAVMGSLIGLWLGWLLLSFVMTQVKVDTVWFQARVSPLSMIISVALTLLSTLIVQFIFTFKLDKINMAEALKSVE